ncbi:MAG: type III pantothenate kinase [Marinagarivorans sp.]
MRILELDLGNSCTKWRLADLGLSGSLPSDELVQLKALPTDWAGLTVDSIWLASVLADAATQAAVGSLQRVFACDVHRAYSSPAAAGVINGYAEPNRLGVDRWLALLAARQFASGDLVVADAGTAVTLDLLRADGQHLGGYILPGVARQAQSLWGGTGRVQVSTQALRPRFEPGDGTEACVEAALTAALMGLCVSAQRRLPQATWYLTGGDAHWLQAICARQQLPSRCESDLVLDGLAHAQKLPYPAP